MDGDIRTSPAGRLLAPGSVAFVGISTKGTGAGAKMLKSVQRSGFDGPVWPVHPTAEAIGGVRAYPSLAALPGRPDCLVVAVPGEAVQGVVEEAAALGIPAALVVSEGFADAGTEEGRARQEALVATARGAGMALAGPNCMGIATLGHRFAATMADIPADLPSGGISLVSQSGGLLNAVAELASNRGIGMNYLISIGNQAVLDLADYIDYLACDPATKVIAVMMEGAKNGRRFRAAVERASRVKPLVVLKLGQSEAGQAATLAHTGTLAGQHAAYEALFRRAGVASVESIDELVETAALLAALPLPSGNRLCLLTVSGGATSLISDLGEKAGLGFPPLAPATVARVGQALGIERAFGNPLDTVGMPRLRQPGALEGVVGALLDDPGIDMIGLVLGMRLEGAENHDKLVGRLADLAVTARKPLFTLSFISNSLTDHWRDFGRSRGMPLVEDLELGLRAIRHLSDYAAFRRAIQGDSTLPRFDDPAPCEGTGGEALSEVESKKILGAAGLPVTQELLARTPEEAATLAARFAGPVALKIQSPDIPHKSDIGGVRLGLRAEGAAAAAAEILANAARACPEARIEGVLVQEMIGGGAEFILGMTYDDQFGPLIVAGGGGVMVEIFKDAASGLAPLGQEEAEAMVAGLKVSALLDGFRGAPRLDRAALVDTLVRFSEFVAETDGQYAAIDLNPVFVLEEGAGVRIADALIVRKAQREERDDYLDETGTPA